MAEPCALVLSCSDFAVENLVKQILGCDQLPAASPVVDTIKSYPWHIETKYYTADIRLCTIQEKSLGNLEFAENVHGVVIYFDSDKRSSFKKVEEWMSFVKEFSPEVRLLVCDRCIDTEQLTRKEVQKWSLENDFELVELCPEECIDIDDDFPETTGIKRIIQALHSHVWPNLKMKDKPGYSVIKVQPKVPETLEEPEEIDVLVNKLSGLNTEAEKQAGLSLNDAELIKMLGAEDPDGVSFETLFERFSQMKETAQHLPFEERKVYAEKVALAFWHAMGGDESEIEGLDDEK